MNEGLYLELPALQRSADQGFITPEEHRAKLVLIRAEICDTFDVEIRKIDLTSKTSE